MKGGYAQRKIVEIANVILELMVFNNDWIFLKKYSNKLINALKKNINEIKISLEHTVSNHNHRVLQNFQNKKSIESVTHSLEKQNETLTK